MSNTLNHIGYAARAGLVALTLTPASCAVTNQCTKETQRVPNAEQADIVLYHEGLSQDTVKINYPTDTNCTTKERDCEVPDPKDPAKTEKARCIDTICANGGYVESRIVGTKGPQVVRYKFPDVVFTYDPNTNQLVRTAPKDTKKE